MLRRLVIGIDVGGTFTDVVLFEPASGQLAVAKVPSTPANQALGVMAGFEALRMFKDDTPPVTIKVVDWADEEGARFSRSLLG